MGMTIKEFRLSQKLSQPKLAKALGIGVSTVGAYEVGKIKPSKKVYAKIKEVFGVDLEAATPTPVPEAAPAKKTSKAKKEKAAPAPAPAVEKKEAAPAKKASKAKKEEAAPAPAVEEKKAAPAKKASKAKKEEAAPVAEKKGAPAKKPRAKKEAAPAKTSKPKKATSSKQAAIVIQSPMGGEITTEDILAKIGDVDKAYVRVDQNTIYWVKGEKSGAVNIW